MSDLLAATTRSSTGQQDGWASTQRTRLDWERRAFSKLLDANEAAPDGQRSEVDMASGGDEHSAPSIAEPLGRVNLRVSGSEPERHGIRPLSGLMPSTAAVPGSEDGASVAHAGVASLYASRLPMEAGNSEATSVEPERAPSSARRNGEEPACWSALVEGEAHVAVRVADGAESVKTQLDALFTHLGLQPRTLKINGISYESDAQKRGDHHGS